MFPADLATWIDGGPGLFDTRRVHTDDVGNFRLWAMRPGDYIVMATPSGGADDWPNARFVRTLMKSPAARRVHLDEGTTVSELLQPVRVSWRNF